MALRSPYPRVVASSACRSRDGVPRRIHLVRNAWITGNRETELQGSRFPTLAAMNLRQGWGMHSLCGYFHSHILETVAPEASTSYSKATHALLRRASFCEAVRKNSIPR